MNVDVSIAEGVMLVKMIQNEPILKTLYQTLALRFFWRLERMIQTVSVMRLTHKPTKHEADAAIGAVRIKLIMPM